MNKDSTVITRIEFFTAITLFFAFLVYFTPSLNNEIRVHDTYDGNFSTRHLLVHSGHFFDLNPNNIVPGTMNGLERGLLPRFTEVTSLLMWLFGSLNGMAITFILVRLIGLIGIYLLGRDHFKVDEKTYGVLALIAVAFACLPVFTIHGLTVMGVPILLWAYYNMYKNEKIKTSLIVFMTFALWSNLILVGVHIIFVLTVLTICHWISDRKLNSKIVKGLSLLVLTYLLSEYGMFYLHLISETYHTSRSDFYKDLGLNFKGVIGTSIIKFFSDDYAAASYFGYLFIPFLVFLTIYLIKKKEYSFSDKLVVLFFGVLLLSAIFISILDWTGMLFFYEKFKFAKSFNLQRFTNLIPAFFFSLVLVSVNVVLKKNSLYLKFGTYFVILLFIGLVWRGNITFNRSGFDTRGLKIYSFQKTTFNEFFDPALYHKIKMEMGPDTNANVIHFGISPSPAKYAGLAVLDDYQGDYPKEYKIEFRKIIEGELNKSESLKKYFDGWGSRSYMYSAGVFEENMNKQGLIYYEPNLTINTVQLKKMNCRTILSSIRIGNYIELGLKLKKVLVSSLDYKVILVYSIG